jgi:hypothetical protein
MENPVWQTRGGGVFYDTAKLPYCQTAKLSIHRGYRVFGPIPVWQFGRNTPPLSLPNWNGKTEKVVRQNRRIFLFAWQEGVKPCFLD